MKQDRRVIAKADMHTANLDFVALFAIVLLMVDFHFPLSVLVQ